MRRRALLVLVGVALAGAACGDAGGDETEGAEPTQTAEGQVAAPVELADLQLDKPKVVVPAGVLNPTVALDPRSGAVYLAWAREVPGPTPNEPVLQAVVARSTDEGKTFSEPVVVSRA